MRKSAIKYHVTLTGGEREFLEKLVRKGKTAGYRIRHAQILLAVDEIPANEHWTDGRIAAAYSVAATTVNALRKRFVEAGFEAALERKKRLIPPVIKVDGEAEAKIVALACSEPPEGRVRWTLQLLADKAVELGILDSISDNGIRGVLKKTKLNPGWSNNGVFPKRRPSS